MVRIEYFFTAAALLDQALAINPKCSSYTGLQKLIATVAARVSPYPVAQSYCSKNFAIPTSTTTSTASARTVTTTVATSTATTTVATSTTTSTITNTATSTTTVTITVTAAAKKLKRDAAPNPAPVTSPSTLTTITTTGSVQAASAALTSAAVAAQASPSQVLNNLAAFNRAIVASICTCVENTPVSTVTTTPTSTSSATATVTTSVTATSTASTTVTITTVTTSTSTSTAAAPQTTCVNQQRCYQGFLIQNYCNTKFNMAVGPSNTIQGVASGEACGNGCAADSACVVFDFNSATGQCQYYSSGTPATFNSSPDVNHYSGYLADYC